MKAQYYIGIDTGTNTGVAIWDSELKRFEDLMTIPIHRAIKLVEAYSERKTIKVIVEDARQVKFKTSPEKAQGAGYVKAHAQIWEAFLTDKNIPFEMVRPKKSITKWTAEIFLRQTGQKGSTTHSRDAAMLVYGR